MLCFRIPWHWTSHANITSAFHKSHVEPGIFHASLIKVVGGGVTSASRHFIFQKRQCTPYGILFSCWKESTFHDFTVPTELPTDLLTVQHLDLSPSPFESGVSDQLLDWIFTGTWNWNAGQVLIHLVHYRQSLQRPNSKNQIVVLANNLVTVVV